MAEAGVTAVQAGTAYCDGEICSEWATVCVDAMDVDEFVQAKDDTTTTTGIRTDAEFFCGECYSQYTASIVGDDTDAEEDPDANMDDVEEVGGTNDGFGSDSQAAVVVTAKDIAAAEATGLRIKLASDVHLEHYTGRAHHSKEKDVARVIADVVRQPVGGADVLVLAGDLGWLVTFVQQPFDAPTRLRLFLFGMVVTTKYAVIYLLKVLGGWCEWLIISAVRSLTQF
jgi:hypothetical protein